MQKPQFFLNQQGQKIAYHHHAGGRPGLFFLGGFRSDMSGTKALFLQNYAAERGLGFTRMDYRGHGQSDGDFADFAIGDWAQDALDIFDTIASGPQILIGSSMGAWVMCLLGLQRPSHVVGYVGIAPAPDFTEQLMWPELPEAAKQAIRQQGYYDLPSAYDPRPTRLTRRLFDDGKDHLVLPRLAQLDKPLRVLHGMADPDVPWAHGVAMMQHWGSKDVRLKLIKDGDHRLSRPEDLHALADILDALRRQLGL